MATGQTVYRLPTKTFVLHPCSIRVSSVAKLLSGKLLFGGSLRYNSRWALLNWKHDHAARCDPATRIFWRFHPCGEIARVAGIARGRKAIAARPRA
jgi:hypothetical protein